MTAHSQPVNITFFICEQMLATSITLPMEQLKAADNLARVAHTQNDMPEMVIRLASVDGRPVMSNTGLQIMADCAVADIQRSDITYLPALWRNPQRLVRRVPTLLGWLTRQYELGNTIAGVGTGCCFMAETGMLNGKAATTHWHYFEQFEKLYPLVQLKRQYFITQADNLYCTGSVNSLADLTIHFIQRYFGGHIARHVERHFFHEIRKSYSNLGGPQGTGGAHPDEDIIRAQIWLQENFAQDVVLAQVAPLFDMSVRSFNRRFKSATGLTPLQYLHNIRIQIAKDLLQTSNLTVGEIAYRSGYQDLAHFTRLFKRILGLTPSQYRTMVRAKMFSL